MKLSEMDTNRAADALCELVPYVANIAADEQLMEELSRTIKPQEAKCRAELYAQGAEKLSKIAEIVFKKHRSDALGILGVVNGKDAEEMGKQNILVTMRQLRDIAKDKELIDFFKSCADTKESE